MRDETAQRVPVEKVSQTISVVGGRSGRGSFVYICHSFPGAPDAAGARAGALGFAHFSPHHHHLLPPYGP